MKGMQWVAGAVALVVFDAALIWGVRYWQAHRVPGLEAAPPAVTSGVSVGTAVVPYPALPLQTACVAGATWAYDVTRERWFKPEPALRCEVGDVRQVLRREGATRVYPKPK